MNENFSERLKHGRKRIWKTLLFDKNLNKRKYLKIKYKNLLIGLGLATWPSGSTKPWLFCSPMGKLGSKITRQPKQQFLRSVLPFLRLYVYIYISVLIFFPANFQRRIVHKANYIPLIRQIVRGCSILAIFTLQTQFFQNYFYVNSNVSTYLQYLVF